jgi:hypothetical protein
MRTGHDLLVAYQNGERLSDRDLASLSAYLLVCYQHWLDYDLDKAIDYRQAWIPVRQELIRRHRNSCGDGNTL